MANNPNSDGLECVLCGALFTTKPDLQEHFRSHGSKNDSQMKDQRVSENIANFNPPSTCELCGKIRLI